MSDRQKKKVYLVQPNYLYGTSAYLPYAVGVIAAYAFSDKRIAENYELGRFIYLREDIDRAIESLDNPCFVGFSNYVWNFEYNKEFARRLKKAFPECVVAFGGHNVPPDASLLYEEKSIDILMHGQGEETFLELLLAINDSGSFENIKNISYRKGSDTVSTERTCTFRSDYPSPFLMGLFDDIVNNDPYEFTAAMETNRGCPYSCAYCDWGGEKHSIVKFPMERIKKEIDWLSEHKVRHLGCADSNYGIFERDSEIIDYVIDVKKRTGYPDKFRVSYAKNSNKTVFEISKKLNDCGMSKGASLSFQTLSEAALKNIGRENMSPERFKELMEKYESAGIPTYSELIIGLPGETKESFSDGLETLLRAGQHTSLYVYFCELLVNSEMGSREYMERFDIGCSKVPLNQSHCESVESDIEEYSHVVTKTYSMSTEDWIESNLFSVAVQCFHCFALLQFFAIYLLFEKNVGYREFYEKLLLWMKENKNALCSEVFKEIREALYNAAYKNGSLQLHDDRFGTISWPLEEAAFLKLLAERERFYKEIESFLESFCIDNEIYDQLLLYQKSILRVPGEDCFKLSLKYDFHSFFASAYKGEHIPLKKVDCVLCVNSSESADNFKDFARDIVWYGRKGSNMIHKKNTKVIY